MNTSENDIDNIIGKCLAGEATREETAYVNEWRLRARENERYYKNLELIFEKALLVKNTNTYNTDAAWKKVQAQLHTKTKIRFIDLPLVRIAASLLLLSAIGVWAYFQLTEASSTIELTSESAIVRDSLPDGTKVVLNKHSQLSVDYNADKKQGRIHLKGEANFEIAHDSEKKLIVQTDEVLIRDIGTVFNVRAFAESNVIEVTVQEGEVQFYTASTEGIFVKAGGKGVYNKQTKTFSLQQADTNVVAYATRQFTFEESDLQTVVQQLNAVYDRKIKIAESLKACRITVNFNNEEIETIAEIIAETLNLRITTTTSEITLEGEGCE